MNFFDLHSHLHFSDFDESRTHIIAEMRAKGVGTMVVGTGVETSKQAVTFAHTYSDIATACIGIHPHDALEVLPILEQHIQELDQLCVKNSDIVAAIGETGLDYFRLEQHTDLKTDQNTYQDIEQQKSAQKAVFIAQIALAQKFCLPLMIHCRDAHEDIFKILDAYNHKDNPHTVHVHMHFFTANKETLIACLDRGYTVSFPGVVTFVQAVADLLDSVPNDRYMLETDAPYAAPKPHRGKQSNPLMVQDIAVFIAQKKNIAVEEVYRQTQENIHKYFPKALPKGGGN